jgi:hypothetical protein
MSAHHAVRLGICQSQSPSLSLSPSPSLSLSPSISLSLSITSPLLYSITSLTLVPFFLLSSPLPPRYHTLPPFNRRMRQSLEPSRPNQHHRPARDRHDCRDARSWYAISCTRQAPTRRRQVQLSRSLNRLECCVAALGSRRQCPWVYYPGEGAPQSS